MASKRRSKARSRTRRIQGTRKTESCIGFEGKSLHSEFLLVGVMKRWGTSSWSDYTTVETACDRFCGDGCPVGS
jgi:hypothetical protein